MMKSLNDVKSCNTIRICYFTYNAYYSKGASVKKAIHSLLNVKIMNKDVENVVYVQQYFSGNRTKPYCSTCVAVADLLLHRVDACRM
jgi:hypothetical protein